MKKPDDTLLLITTGSDESETASDPGDTIKVRIGEKNIEIIEHEDKTSVDIYDDEDEKMKKMTFPACQMKIKSSGDIGPAWKSD